MRIVDLITFRAMPEGTVFMKYAPIHFGSLCVKGETWDVDFLFASLDDALDVDSSEDFVIKLDAAKDNPDMSLSMDYDCYQRDGMFKENQLFAVLEKPDVDELIKKLQECLTSYR